MNIDDYPSVLELLASEDTELRIASHSETETGQYLIIEQTDSESGGQYLLFKPLEGAPTVIAADTTVFPLSVASIPGDHRDELAKNFIESEQLFLRETGQLEDYFSSPFTDDFGMVAPELEGAMALFIRHDNNSLRDKIFTSAKRWEDKLSSANIKGTSGGKLACAWAVNYVVRHATGKSVGGHLSTSNMSDALKKGRGIRVSEKDAEPGDVVISPTQWFNGKRVTGHVGIVGQGDDIYSNSSSRALWKQNYSRNSWNKRYEGKGLDVAYYKII